MTTAENDEICKAIFGLEEKHWYLREAICGKDREGPKIDDVPSRIEPNNGRDRLKQQWLMFSPSRRTTRCL